MSAVDLNSESTGDPGRHLTAAELARLHGALAPAPRERGVVVRVVARRDGGRRDSPSSIMVSPEGGVAGDAWGRRPDRKRDAQVTVMQTSIASLIANGQPLELFGDNLFVDLDLSHGNLPPGLRHQFIHHPHTIGLLLQDGRHDEYQFFKLPQIGSFHY